MALFKFTKAILKGEPIDVYNFGNHTRDFTYIDDIVNGVIKVLDCPTVSNSNWNSKQPDPATSSAPWRIFNIGNNKPIKLLDYINALEEALGKKAKKNYMPMQLGDVSNTCADIDDLFNNFNFKPSTKVNEGIVNFVNWYKSYYKLNE
jgi:UDP-glucuronate 4-epimerase